MQNYYIGDPDIYVNTLFGNCPNLRCPVTFGFDGYNNLAEVTEAVKRLGEWPVYYTNYGFLVSTTDVNDIVTFDFKITQTLNSNPAIMMVISSLVFKIFKNPSTGCSVTSLTPSFGPTLSKATFLLGGSAANVYFPQFT